MKPRHFILMSLVCCTILSQHSNPLAAEESAAGDEPLDLDPVVVVARRLPQQLSAVAAQVTVIDSGDIQRSLAEDIDGLLKYEPSLELQTSGSRFGTSSINIRGIEGNRVYTEVDGVPLRDQFIIGAYSNAGRLAVETDRVKRVEVLHGPASVMYGSHALGGVVSISTWDPTDMLMQTGSPWWLGLRTGYQGMNDSWVASGVYAWGEGKHGLLAAASRREGHEMDHQAAADTPPDPQDWKTEDFMFRYTLDTAGGNLLRVTVDRWEREVETDIQSLLGYGRRFRWTTSMQGDDHDESRRLSVNYDFSTPGGLLGSLVAFDTSADTDQWTYEQRKLAPQPVAIDRRFQYSQDISGAKGFVSREADWGGSRHQLALGAEWSKSDIVEARDGLQTSLVDGSVSNVILGETMPVRDFPISRTQQTGLWLQDTIQLASGRWEITPALRWDSYDLDPQPDETWREDNPDTEVVSVSEDRMTPRLGVLFHAGEQWSLYGQYTEGFRAPPFEDANIGLDIPLFGFRAIPNPDLRSETSQGFEVGTRRMGTGSRLSVALFQTEYDDFIESRVLIGRDPDSGDLIFQSRNIDRARIRGIDLRYEQELTDWDERFLGWTMHLAAYWAEGENRQTDEALNSIAPPQGIAGLAWNSADGTLDFNAVGTFTARKSGSDIDSSEGPRFATPSWVTLDLTAGWRASERFELRAGIFNVTNETYWRWLDVSKLEADDPMIPLLSRPGRSFSVSLNISF
jgi:hemoglobin/transferrin/lactoferrin receptor protein